MLYAANCFLSQRSESLAYVQTSPLPQKKSGEESLLPIFFCGRKDVCTQGYESLLFISKNVLQFGQFYKALNSVCEMNWIGVMIACVASVSSRGSSRKLGQEQKNEWRGRGRGTIFCFRSNFRVITRLETLATQASVMKKGLVWNQAAHLKQSWPKGVCAAKRQNCLEPEIGYTISLLAPWKSWVFWTGSLKRVWRLAMMVN